jgi:hypothetical protein
MEIKEKFSIGDLIKFPYGFDIRKKTYYLGIIVGKKVTNNIVTYKCFTNNSFEYVQEAVIINV